MYAWGFRLPGMDNATTHPVVMGKLQGPYGIPAASFSSPRPLSAGFIVLVSVVVQANKKI